MYLDFYSLSENPFRITPDPEFFFLSPGHKESLRTVIYGIEDRKGFVAIIGATGLGKTTILRYFLEKTNPEKLKTIPVFHANISFASLIKAIYRELGLVADTEDILEQINHLYHVLLEEYNAGRYVALLIDNAQDMSTETLENVRMLSNLETATDKLLQIVLVGQPEFEQKLNLHELRQLRQRIVIHTTLSPLTQEQSKAYIQHHLDKVITSRRPLLTKRAIKQIVKQAKGVPRTLNTLCDNALIAGFRHQQKPITAKMVKEMIADAEGKQKHPLLRWGIAGTSVIILLGGFFWTSPYKNLAVAKLESLQPSQVIDLIPINLNMFNETRVSDGPSDIVQSASTFSSAQEETAAQEKNELIPIPTQGVTPREEDESRSIVLQEPTTQEESILALLPTPQAIVQEESELAVSLVPESAGQVEDASAALSSKDFTAPEEKPALALEEEDASQEGHMLTLGMTQEAGIQNERASSILPILSEALSEDHAPLETVEQAPTPLPAVSEDRFKEVLLEKLLAGTPGQTQQHTFSTTRVVKKADSLNQLVLDVYGHVSDTLIEWVKEHNPHIKNADRIEVGERILFPALPELPLSPARAETMRSNTVESLPLQEN